MIDRGGSRGWTNKIKSRLSIVDRGGSWCWPYKVKSSLGIVVWGWSRSRANKVQGRLCIVVWGRSNRGGNECKFSILVCLPLGRSLNLSLATTGSSSNNSLLLSNIVQLLLVPVPTSCSKRSHRWGNMCKLSILVCLPFWGPNNLNLSLATPGSGSNNSLLLSQSVQLVLCIVATSSCKRSNRWSNVCKLCVLECLPFWGSYDRHMLSSREGNTGQRYNLGEHTEWSDHFCWTACVYRRIPRMAGIQERRACTHCSLCWTSCSCWW